MHSLFYVIMKKRWYKLITADVIRVLNIMFILLLMITIFVGVFIDSRKQGTSMISSLGWAFFCSFVFPPFGVIIYVIYRKKR